MVTCVSKLTISCIIQQRSSGAKKLSHSSYSLLYHPLQNKWMAMILQHEGSREFQLQRIQILCNYTVLFRWTVYIHRMFGISSRKDVWRDKSRPRTGSSLCVFCWFDGIFRLKMFLNKHLLVHFKSILFIFFFKKIWIYNLLYILLLFFPLYLFSIKQISLLSPSRLFCFLSFFSYSPTLYMYSLQYIYIYLRH